MCLNNFVRTVALPLSKGWDAKSKPWTGPHHVTRDGSMRRFIDAPDSSVQLVDGDPVSSQCHTQRVLGRKEPGPVKQHKAQWIQMKFCVGGHGALKTLFQALS